MQVIGAGQPAPEFSLARFDGERFTAADLQGARTVLVFYPFAFSPTCTDQLQIYNEVLGELSERGATLYGVSCDAGPAQEAFRTHLNIDIAQLSDFEPKGATAKALGTYFEPAGMTNRALVIVGPDGVVRWSHLADSPGDLPGVNLIFDGLETAAA